MENKNKPIGIRMAEAIANKSEIRSKIEKFEDISLLELKQLLLKTNSLLDNISDIKVYKSDKQLHSYLEALITKATTILY